MSASNGSADASKCGSGVTSMRRFRTMGFTCESLGWSASDARSASNASSLRRRRRGLEDVAVPRGSPPRPEEEGSGALSQTLGLIAAVATTSAPAAASASSAARSAERSAAAAAAATSAPGSATSSSSPPPPSESADAFASRLAAIFETGESPSSFPPPESGRAVGPALSGRAEAASSGSAVSAKLSSASASAKETSPAAAALADALSPPRALSSPLAPRPSRRPAPSPFEKSPSLSRPARPWSYAPPCSRSRFARAASDRRTTSRLSADAPRGEDSGFERGDRRFGSLSREEEDSGLIARVVSRATLADDARVSRCGCRSSLPARPGGSVRASPSPAPACRSRTLAARVAASNAGCAGSAFLARRAASASILWFPPSLQNACASISSHARRRAGSFRSKPRVRSRKEALSAPALSSTSRSRFSSTEKSGSSLRIISISSVSDAETKGGAPAAHSYKTHPSAHASEAYECTPSARNSSGAM